MAVPMNRIGNAVWWAVYILVGVLLQVQFPGVDALIPGLILSCHEGRPRQTTWLFLMCILIQEGTGSLHFGSALLWYGGMLLLFALGRGFFVTGSLFFTVLLAVALGGYHALLLYAFSSLQGLVLSTQALVEQAAAQALLIPPLYAVAILIRKRFFDYEYGI